MAEDEEEMTENFKNAAIADMENYEVSSLCTELYDYHNQKVYTPHNPNYFGKKFHKAPQYNHHQYQNSSSQMHVPYYPGYWNSNNNYFAPKKHLHHP